MTDDEVLHNACQCTGHITHLRWLAGSFALSDLLNRARVNYTRLGKMSFLSWFAVFKQIFVSWLFSLIYMNVSSQYSP